MTLTPTKITLGIVTLVFAAGMSWQGIVSRANELEARDEQIAEKHAKDQAEFQAAVTKIGSIALFAGCRRITPFFSR